jgi:hypothetical protein
MLVERLSWEKEHEWGTYGQRKSVSTHGPRDGIEIRLSLLTISPSVVLVLVIVLMHYMHPSYLPILVLTQRY